MIVKCACGCGRELQNKDLYGRNVQFINGHNGRKYQDKAQYKREWNHRNAESRYEYKQKYIKERKSKLIKMLGGECKCCGLKYNGKNGCVFQFHHRDPREKKMQLSLGKIWKHWKVVVEESQKCELVCSNCHFVIHSDEY
jgi:hypothetical protein